MEKIKPTNPLIRELVNSLIKTNIFDDEPRVKAGINRFKNLFFLSPEPLWRKVMIIFNPQVVYTGGVVGDSKNQGVIPAQAGIQSINTIVEVLVWIPAFPYRVNAGMTELDAFDYFLLQKAFDQFFHIFFARASFILYFFTNDRIIFFSSHFALNFKNI